MGDSVPHKVLMQEEQVSIENSSTNGIVFGPSELRVWHSHRKPPVLGIEKKTFSEVEKM